MPSEEDEYADEIFEHQRQVEVTLAPDLEDADLQIELRGNREALISWLLEVHDQYFRRYGSPMIFLTNNIVDRFLSHRRVDTDKLQLVGITALHLAHKFENGIEEKLSDLEYMCNEKYTTDQIARAERFMLYTLDYRLAWPGPLPFLERISKASQESSLTKKVAEYVLEATAVNYACVTRLPSLIAATAFLLAQLLLGNRNWTPGQEESSGFQYSQLYPHMRKFLHWIQHSEHLYKIAYRKYSSSKRGRIAILVTKKLKEDLEMEIDFSKMRFPGSFPASDTGSDSEQN